MLKADGRNYLGRKKEKKLLACIDIPGEGAYDFDLWLGLIRSIVFVFDTFRYRLSFHILFIFLSAAGA